MLFELNKVFYPPSMPTSRFIQVRYTFLNEAGDDDGCTVTYIWAIGILLFFQPPRLFTYNSQLSQQQFIFCWSAVALWMSATD